MFYIPLPPDQSLHQNIYERNTCALDNDTCDHVLMADKYLDIAGASLAEIEDVYCFPQLRIVSTTKLPVVIFHPPEKMITSIAEHHLAEIGHVCDLTVIPIPDQLQGKMNMEEK